MYAHLIHPLSSKSKVGQALTEFSDNFGIHDLLMSDGAPEILDLGTGVMNECGRPKCLNTKLIFDMGTGAERRGRAINRAKPIGRGHANPSVQGIMLLSLQTV